MSRPAATDTQYNNLCERRHPEFADKCVHWDFLFSTYESSRDWFVNNLFKFQREGKETYAGRLQRAYRFNHTREVVDLVNKYLFKTEPIRSESVPEYIKRFRKRSTLSGLNIADFERQVARLSSIYGRIYVVLDNNSADIAVEAGVITEKDEVEGDVRLYAYTVKPQDFLDAAYDDDGQFRWVLLRELSRDDEDPFTGSGVTVEQYRLWTTTGWYLFSQKTDRKGKKYYTKEGEGVHDLGVVPVIKADHIESDNPYSVPALIEDIAYLDRAVANYLSCLDQIINDQTFSQLVMPAQGLLGRGVASTEPLDSDSDPDSIATRQRVIRLSTSQVLLYDGEGGMQPNYISPDPRQANLIISTVKQVINEIYHTVGLAGERTKQDNSLGIDNASGVAKAYDFEKVNGLLSAKANAMQNFSNRLERLARLWHDDNNIPDETAVFYSTSFDVRDLATDLSIAQQLSLMTVPMEVRRKHMTGIVEKLWPLLPEKERATIEKAIANWEDAIYPTGMSVSSDIQTGGDPKGDKAGSRTPSGELIGKPK